MAVVAVKACIHRFSLANRPNGAVVGSSPSDRFTIGSIGRRRAPVELTVKPRPICGIEVYGWARIWNGEVVGHVYLGRMP